MGSNAPVSNDYAPRQVDLHRSQTIRYRCQLWERERLNDGRAASPWSGTERLHNQRWLCLSTSFVWFCLDRMRRKLTSSFTLQIAVTAPMTFESYSGEYSADIELLVCLHVTEILTRSWAGHISGAKRSAFLQFCMTILESRTAAAG